MMSMQAIAWQGASGKRLPNYYECALAWAYRRCENGKSGRVFFEGPVIYSFGHHFPMARIIEVGGREAVFVNSDRYSSSTGRHMGEVRTAVKRAFSEDCVFHLPTHIIKRWEGSLKNHIHVYVCRAEQAKEAFEKARKARSRKQAYLEEAAHHIAETERYAKFFAAPGPSGDFESTKLSLALSEEIELIEAFNEMRATFSTIAPIIEASLRHCDQLKEAA